MKSFYLTAIFIFFIPSLVAAEFLNVQIRTIQASGNGSGNNIQIDRRLSDVQDQLQQLGFSQFKLVSTDQQSVAVREKRTISLANGHRLTVRPLYLEKESVQSKLYRVGMWIHWEDSQGLKLLDTRMHFPCNESMIAGAETGSSNGIILAILVKSE